MRILRFVIKLALLIVLLMPMTVLSQPFVDVFSLDTYSYTRAKYKNNPNASCKSSEVEAYLFLPIPIKSGTSFVLGTDHRYLPFDYSGDTSRHSALNTTTFMLGGQREITGTRWNIALLFIPKVIKIPKDLESDDILLGVATLATFQQNPNLSWRFGLYIHREFYGMVYLPVMGIDWRISRKSSLFGLMPSSMSFEYKINDHFSTGVTYRNTAAIFHLENGPHNVYVVEGNSTLGNNEFYTFLDVYPSTYLVMYAGVGFTKYRQFQLFDSNDHKIFTNKVFNETRDQLLLKIGMAFRIRLDK